MEQLWSRDSAVLVVDFGRLRLANADLADCAPHSPPDDDGTALLAHHYQLLTDTSVVKLL